MFLQQVSTRASNDGSDKFLFGQFNYNLKFQLRGQTNYYGNSQPQIQLIPSTPTKSRQRIKQTCREVKNLMSLNNRIKLKAGLGTGQYFPDLGKLKKVNTEEQSEIKTEIGQIMIFVLWSFEGQTDFIQKFKQFYDKQQNQTKVRIISITLNQQKGAIDKVIKEIEDISESNKEKIKIDHFNITGKESNCSIIYVLGQAIVPYACYVNQNGLVYFVGHPKKLLSVLQKNELKNRNIQEKIQMKNLEGDDVIEGQFLSKFQQNFNSPTNFLKAFPEINFVYINLKVQSRCVRGVVKCKASVQQLCARQDDLKVLIGQIKKIKNLNLENAIIKSTEQQSVPQIPPNCYECKKQLVFPLYWCKFSQQPTIDFRCQQCICKKKQQKEQKNLKTILLFKKTTKIPKQLPQFRNQECSGCRKNIPQNQVSYFCLLQINLLNSQRNYSGPLRICKNCIQKIKKRDEKFDKFLKTLNISQNSSHVWLRVFKQTKKKEEDIMEKQEQDNQQENQPDEFT